MKHICLSIFLAGLFVATASAQERYRGPIIDMHMHAPQDVYGGPGYLPCYPRPCQGPPRAAKSIDEVFDMTIDAMNRHNIVLGFLSDMSGADVDVVYQWANAAPGRFLASPYICDPDDVDLAFIEGEYVAGRLAGMGELGSQKCGLAIDDPSLAGIFALAAKYDVPVLVHSHGTGAPTEQFRISLGNPMHIEEVLVQHPELRLYIEDAGFPFLEETVALMYNYPNVYGDLANLGWMKPRSVFHKYLRELVEYGLGDRLFFGTDQMQWPEAIDEAVEAIQSAEFLTPEQKADIFYNNAARFLRLSDEEIARHHGQ